MNSIFLFNVVDVRLKKVLEEKNELLDEIRRLKLDLEEERNNAKGDRAGLQNNNFHDSPHTNGPENSESAVDSRKSSLYILRSLIFAVVYFPFEEHVAMPTSPLSNFLNNYIIGEANKQIADWRFRVQKYEQEIATLQANVSFIVLMCRAIHRKLFLHCEYHNNAKMYFRLRDLTTRLLGSDQQLRKQKPVRMS